MRLGFQVASVEAAVSAVQQLGADVATPPAAGPWGWRVVIVNPDGQRAKLGQANEDKQ